MVHTPVQKKALSAGAFCDVFVKKIVTTLGMFCGMAKRARDIKKAKRRSGASGGGSKGEAQEKVNQRESFVLHVCLFLFFCFYVAHNRHEEREQQK